jgi:hypothetical protein
MALNHRDKTPERRQKVGGKLEPKKRQIQTWGELMRLLKAEHRQILRL